MTDRPVHEARERIAFTSTESAGKSRWTELEVYYDPSPPAERAGRRWEAKSRGCSSRDGDRTLKSGVVTYSLARALEFFGDSDTGAAVCAQARDWADHHGIADNGDRVGLIADPHLWNFPGGDDKAALDWLFGPGWTAASAADALGLGKATIATALRKGAPVRVALLALAPFLDAEAFRKVRGTGR